MAFDELEAVREGDAEAIDAFLAKWRERLREMSRNLLGPNISAREDTSDVAQEGTLQVWHDLEKFRGSSQEQWEAWVRKIGQGRAANIRRKHLAACRSSNREQVDVAVHADAALTPAEAAERQETLALLIEAIEKLDSREKSVLVLRALKHQSFRAIARHLGFSESTARAHFERAIQQLSRLLAEQGLGDE